MKVCISWKVVAAISLLGLAVFAVAPNLIGTALPLLALAACPLSMVVMMMRAMQGGGRCESASGPASGQSRGERADSAAELARLRAQVDQLRAERAENGGRQPASDTAKA